MSSSADHDKARWIAFATLCLGDLMIVLDSTIVNVALPSIRESLGFSETSLVWVVNAYLLTFGGFMLLSGRLADLYGHRKLFVGGLLAFTAASIACGLAADQTILVIARALQGLGGAVVSAVALALIMALFPDEKERVRAMGYFGFVMAGGGSVGVLLGGLITNLLDWRWVFYVNIPIGLGVIALALKLLPSAPPSDVKPKLDIAGAVLITTALMLAVYGIVNGEQAGWASTQTLGLIGGALVLLAAFLFVESRVAAPLVPLSLFRLRNVTTANIISVLWAAAMFAWFFMSALYLQLVLGYSPMQVGLSFLPANLIMGAFSYNLSAKMVHRFGIRTSLTAGLVVAAAGLALFGVAPANGSFLIHVLPAMLLLGFGSGMAFNPILLASMDDVPPDESGLASGVVNTAFMMGGALGLAILASLAGSVTHGMAGGTPPDKAALTAGYNLAFMVGAGCAFAGAVIARVFLRPKGALGGAAAAAVH